MAIAPGPTLETERLILRPPAAEDLDGWAELMADPVAARYIGGVMTRSQAWRAMATMAGSWALNGFGMFSVIEKDTGLWQGRIGPWAPEGWPGTEVGWSLHPRAQGKGYAVEAAVAAVDFAVDTLEWTRIVHCIDPANTPSMRVAEKIGSRFLEIGRLPEPFQDAPIELWGQTADEWKAQRG
ncbi:MAG: GNAT family N-acetyltransferase [Gemmatimonadaceae bacterium]|nr:GNAT family N-acetyltransferase [Caulobacter sp.]